MWLHLGYYSFTYRKGVHSQFYRSLIRRLNFVEKANLPYDRLKYGLLLLSRLFLLPFYIRIVSNENIPVLVDPFGSNSEGLAKRYAFMKEKFCIDSVHLLSGKNILCGMRDIWKLPILWVIAILFGFYVLFVVKRNYVRVCWSVICTVGSVFLLKNVDFYFWRLYSVPSYLGAYFARNRATFVATDGFLWMWRYTYLPAATLILRSKHQVYEVEALQRTIWFRFNYVDKKLDWLPDLTDSTVPSTKFGLYSSGWWARINGVVRAPLNSVTESGFNNTKSERFNLIISKFAEKRLKAALFLHPFERQIYRDKAILPPYLARYEFYPSVMNLDYESALDFTKVQIGVSLISTVIIDRWNLGLEGIMVINESEDKDIVNKKFLGKYQSKVIEASHFEDYLLAVTDDAAKKDIEN